MNETRRRARVAIVGAGVSGLSAAYFLAAESNNSIETIDVYEASARLGGQLYSVCEKNSVHELGAQTFLMGNPTLAKLISALELENKVIPCGSQRRFLLFRNKLLPLALGALLWQRCLTLLDVLRAALEPLLLFRKPIQNETVAHFFARRFGARFTDRVVRPMLLTMWAGGFEKALASLAVPKLVSLEQRYGSVVLGFLINRLRKGRKATVASGSLRGGVATLAVALAEHLERSDGVLGPRVTLLRDSAVERFELRGKKLEINSSEYDSVIFAMPPWKGPLEPPTALASTWKALRQIEAQSVVVVSFAVPKNDANAPVGYGAAVVDSRCGMAGIVFVHSVYSQLAADGKALFRVVYGVERNSTVSVMSDAALIDFTVERLKESRILSENAKPVSSVARRVEAAIPIPTPSLVAASEAVTQLQKEFPQIAFCGSYFNGASVGACVESAQKAAKRVSSYVKTL